MLRRMVSLCSIGLAFGSSVWAGDWPQILGPTRDAWARDETLPERLDGKAIRPRWELPVGSGLSGPVVVGDRVILFHRRDDDLVLQSWSVSEGRSQWTATTPTRFQPQIVPDDGPRATPAVAGKRVFAYGPEGTLLACDLTSGKILWKVDTHAEFGANEGYFGAGSSPLANETTVFVNVGGKRQAAGVVAFAAASGKVLWKAVSDDASYSAPMLAKVDDRECLIVVTRLTCTALDPATGKELWSTPFGQRGPTVNAALPVGDGRRLLLTASYGIGAELLTISSKSVDVTWSDQVLASQYTTPLWRDGTVWGIDGRQDGPPATLKCFDASTRKVHWEESGLQYATLIGAGKRGLLVQSDGTVRMFEITTESYHPLGEFRAARSTTRALPALAGGCLYLRDETHLRCFELSSTSAKNP